MHSTIPVVLHRTKMASKRYAVQGLKRLNKRAITNLVDQVVWAMGIWTWIPDPGSADAANAT
jgi:hypothetical protein